MKIILTIMLYLSLLPCVYASDISMFENRLISEGKTYLEKMHENGGFEYVLYLIEYGNDEAINFAPELKKYTDAADTEAILISLGRALNKNTVSVLNLIPHQFSFEQICTIPFIEAPNDIVEIHIDQAIYNLKKIKKTDGVSLAAEQCLSIFYKLKMQNLTLIRPPAVKNKKVH